MSSAQGGQEGRSTCQACPGECVDACFNDAIVRVGAEGVAILEQNCAGCGACVPACALGLIRLRHGVARFTFTKPD